MFAYSWNFYYFISAFFYISCQACEKGANPEQAFVDDFTKKGAAINKLIVEQVKDDVAKKLCAAALHGAGKLPNENDLNQVSVDNLNPLQSSFLKSPFYKSALFKDKLSVWPTQCSIKNQKDTNVFFEFASTIDKIYLMKPVVKTTEFQFENTICVGEPDNNGPSASNASLPINSEKKYVLHRREDDGFPLGVKNPES